MREKNASTVAHPDIEVFGPLHDGFDAILSPDALAFLTELCQTFGPRVDELLARREQQQAAYDRGDRPVFLRETRTIRRLNWIVAPLPSDLRDRRVEITGPVDRKMIINALNSGANVFMADFEDATSPTWANVISGQINLRDAVNRTVRFENEAGRLYELHDEVATLMVRPRGWHLFERHIHVAGRFAPAALVDFGLFFFHNAHELIRRGSGPYFYLPKLQSHLEARLWNDVFVYAQEALGIPSGTIKATVLIETLPAAFEMDEILHELREHSAGLNCGRWDYIFSFIKTFRADKQRLLPDRGQVTMEQPFMRAYSQLLIRTCHRRGVHAIGGMAAQVPIKDDPVANAEAIGSVRADKLREVKNGHDGTWVAHPTLVPVARAIFDKFMRGPHQIHVKREDVNVSGDDLCRVPTGFRTEGGLRNNIQVGVQYLEAWLRGHGCVPLYHLMEDAATAEISRAQVWQWLNGHACLSDGRPVTVEFFETVLEEEMRAMERAVGFARFNAGRFREASIIFRRLSTAATCQDFLTLDSYPHLLTLTGTDPKNQNGTSNGRDGRRHRQDTKKNGFRI